MEAHLITADGQSPAVDQATLEGLISSSTKFWLDLAGLDAQEAETLLCNVFRFHPLAVEDAEKFQQRPKLDFYDDHALMVVYGAEQVGDLVEVHCFYTSSYLVTVHQRPVPMLEQLAERMRRNPGSRADHIMLLHGVVDTLVDGFFPLLGSLDDEIDELEDEILERPTEEQLGRLFDMKRSLIAVRKVVTPQRDVFASLLARGGSLPGMTPDAERYFRDIYDHLIRISDLVDSYRDLLSGALDTHLSTVSNRLNVVMKQLTIIATVFLPLSFLTGFFGQNFGWMVGRLGSLTVFVGVGIGTQVVAVAVLVLFFKKKGWLSADGTVPPATAARRRRLARDRRWHAVAPRSLSDRAVVSGRSH